MLTAEGILVLDCMELRAECEGEEVRGEVNMSRRQDAKVRDSAAYPHARGALFTVADTIVSP